MTLWISPPPPLEPFSESVGIIMFKLRIPDSFSKSVSFFSESSTLALRSDNCFVNQSEVSVVAS